MPILTEEQYLEQHGAGFDFGDPGTHKLPGLSKGQRDRIARRVFERDEALALRREELRAAYRAEVEAGTVRPPSRLERLMETAAGPPGRPAVQAARRILKKRFQIDFE